VQSRNPLTLLRDFSNSSRTELLDLSAFSSLDGLFFALKIPRPMILYFGTIASCCRQVFQLLLRSSYLLLSSFLPWIKCGTLVQLLSRPETLDMSSYSSSLLSFITHFESCKLSGLEKGDNKNSFSCGT